MDAESATKLAMRFTAYVTGRTMGDFERKRVLDAKQMGDSWIIRFECSLHPDKCAEGHPAGGLVREYEVQITGDDAFLRCPAGRKAIGDLGVM